MCTLRELFGGLYNNGRSVVEGVVLGGKVEVKVEVEAEEVREGGVEVRPEEVVDVI